MIETLNNSTFDSFSAKSHIQTPVLSRVETLTMLLVGSCYLLYQCIVYLIVMVTLRRWCRFTFLSRQMSIYWLSMNLWSIFKPFFYKPHKHLLNKTAWMVDSFIRPTRCKNENWIGSVDWYITANSIIPVLNLLPNFHFKPSRWDWHTFQVDCLPHFNREDHSGMDCLAKTYPQC